MASWHNDEEGDVMVPGALYSELACKKDGERREEKSGRQRGRQQGDSVITFTL